MKAKLFVLSASVLLLSLHACIPFNLVKGDGNLVTHTIPIADYDKLSGGFCSMEVIYTQSGGEPFLQVTTDSNIYDMYEFFTDSKDNTLKIRPKEQYRRNTRFDPTQFTVTTNSAILRGINLAGNCKFDANSTLSTGKLDVNLSGNGRINLNDSAFIDTLKVALAGNGKMNAFWVENMQFDGSVAGSGNFNLKGTGRQARIEIAGSGKMQAVDFAVEELTASIAGSGNIEITATEKLDIEVAGSGNVRYKGNPVIRQSIAGSGKITKID